MKEGNVLFNDALNTFYLRLYGVRHMVKNHSDRERGIPLSPHRPLFPISRKGLFYMHHPTDRITHTTAFLTPVMGPWYVLSCLWDYAYKKELLLLFGKSSPCGGSGFILSLYE